MTRRLLTSAEVIGITGAERPLTPADQRLAAERAAHVIGDPDRTTWGCCGSHDVMTFVACQADRHGIWVRVLHYHNGDPDDPSGDVHAGHIPWPRVAQLARPIPTATQDALFEVTS